MGRKKIVKDKDGKQVEIDQDAIDAALAGAVSNVNGMPISAPKSNETTNECTVKPDAKPSNDKCCEDDKCCTKEGGQIASDQKKFGEDCFNFNIDAKKCHYQSVKNEDKSILDYVRAINKKIYDETCVGGFSTNVQFRVTPQDWVNVSHIQDWYRARGFEVVDKGTTSPAYGKEVGTMNYNFTISWANAQ